MKIQELLAQRAEIDRQIEVEKSARLADCVQRALSVFTDEGFSVGEAADALSTRFSSNARKSKKAARNAVAPKYRQVSGTATWSGRGRKPAWFKDGDYTEA